ncbi:MAG: hypothetical protein AAF267_22395 [Deinococcota bacterium]
MITGLMSRWQQQLPTRLSSTLVILLLTALLAACGGDSPAEFTAPEEPSSSFISVAELGSGLVGQDLAEGLSISQESDQITDIDGVRNRESVYLVSTTSDLVGLTLYPIETPRTLAGTNVASMRDATGNLIDDASVAQGIMLETTASLTAANIATVDALLDADISVLGDGAITTEQVGDAWRVTLNLSYPFDEANPGSNPDSFLLLFAFVEDTTQADPRTLSFSMSDVGIVTTDPAIELVISASLEAPVVTLP